MLPRRGKGIPIPYQHFPLFPCSAVLHAPGMLTIYKKPAWSDRAHLHEVLYKGDQKNRTFKEIFVNLELK